MYAFIDQEGAEPWLALLGRLQQFVISNESELFLVRMTYEIWDPLSVCFRQLS